MRESSYHRTEPAEPANPKDSPNTSPLYLALEAASSGLAVFPLQGKEPTTGATPNGYKDATRDRSRITAMFNRAGKRATGYGIATGAASWRIVVDVDGPEALDEAKRRGLTSGHVVKTGRPEGGGFHLYFALEPGLEVKSRTLSPGLELKAERCYVVGPGSLHPSGDYYQLARDGKPSPAPAALTEPPEALRGQVAHRERRTGDTPVALDVAGPPIPEGGRNLELTRIAGRLHDGTRDLEALTHDLEAINNARCVPPLEAAEVAAIAKSISGKAPCKAAPTITPEVLEALDSIEARLWRIGWRGMGELSARDVYVALILAGRTHGTLIPAGVRVSISVRALALAAAVSKRTAHYALKRLKAAGLVRGDNAERAGTKSGALVLLSDALGGRATLHHSPTGVGLASSGASLRAPRLRWSGQRFDRVGDETIRSTIRRLGKSCGAVIDALERFGGTATVTELAAALHKSRTRDLRSRTIARLETAAVVECSGDTVALAPDWLEALDREREISGEFAAYQRDMRRFNDQRRAYRERDKIRPEPVPERPPDGEIAELERVPEPAPALVAALREYLRLNPRLVDEGPSWLAVALWAGEHVQGKPTPEAVEAALSAIECENRAA